MASERDRTYRVGIIGTGLQGTKHAQAFAEHPAAEVVAGADTDAANLALFGERFGLTAGLYADYEEMLAHEELDIVCPILPTGVNPDAVVAAAEAGARGVLCEKPIAATLADADRMVDVCHAHGVKFGAGDMYRNYEQLWRAREMIAAGEIGDVISIVNRGPANSGSGCQDLSVVRLFAGDVPVEWVVGWSNGRAMDETLDAVDASSDHDQELGGVIRFSSGLSAQIVDNPGLIRGIEVLCERGVFTSDYRSFRLLERSARPVNRRSLFDLVEMPGLFEDWVDWGGRYEDGYDAAGWLGMASRQAATAQSMIDALEKDIEPRANGENARDVLELAIAMRESERRGHQPVTLPLEDRSLQILPAAVACTTRRKSSVRNGTRSSWRARSAKRDERRSSARPSARLTGTAGEILHAGNYTPWRLFKDVDSGTGPSRIEWPWPGVQLSQPGGAAIDGLNDVMECLAGNLDEPKTQGVVWRWRWRWRSP